MTFRQWIRDVERPAQQWARCKSAWGKLWWLVRYW